MELRRILKGAPTVLLVVDVIIRITALLTIPRRLRPTTAMAWLIAIFVAPIPASLLFGIFGSTKLPKDRRLKQEHVDDRINEVTAALDPDAIQPRDPIWFRSLVGLNQKLGAVPMVENNDLRLFHEYDESIAAMVEAIDGAKHYVHAEFYIFCRDDTTRGFFDALLRAKERGVKVRVLFDNWSTMTNPAGKATRQWFIDNGIPFRAMLPFRPLRLRPDLRNHRKIVIVDGAVAFTGSQNMIDRSYDKPGNQRRGLQWKDLVVRVEGPAAVGLDALFRTDWYSETDDIIEPPSDAGLEFPDRPDGFEVQVVPSGPGFDGENNLRLFNALMYQAEHKLIVTSPYFVPDDSMLYAITTAAQRGVDVQLFACAVADQFMVFHAQRSYYETLLRAGVRIFLYEKPTVLHAKHFTIDDDVAVVGSSNMDMRSFSLNLEVSLMVRGERFVSELRDIEDHYRAHSTEMTLDEWLERPALSQTFDTVARLASALA